ncbi:hypothetical protein [Tuwongella immobilis]|uniref:Uncharacterized protein n=1 Tax=Tuwongella immobilis TaxID=692036 RepID=A0A6C2YMT3_9BACT|nr:hypothetical protein [Tuwongella immobilis]VIP02910.1 unnamed protein product [Tuwongella immobilis]VTS02818.1 unnamed protein product [Tuwongella immobilis]
MKMDKELLMKHHFWVLFLVLLPVLMILLAGLMTSVAGATDARRQEISAMDGKLKGSNPKAKGLLEKLEAQKQELYTRRGEMWKVAWDKQKDVYVWPSQLEHLQESKRFGMMISESDRNQISSGELYFNQYREMNKIIEPTQFNGSWEQVMRYVPTWVKVPTSEEVWLAFEDIWVQRELLRIIRETNDELALFARAKGDQDSPLERTFTNRVWKLVLRVVDKGNDRIMEGELTNLSDRVQVFGLGNIMTLKVWLNDDERQEPYLLKLEGDFVKAGATVKVGGNPKLHKLDADKAANLIELFKVQQKFDIRTVPIKRIEKIAMGYGGARTTAFSPLKPPAFSKKIIEEKKAALEAAAADSGAGGGMPGMPGSPGMPGMAMPGMDSGGGRGMGRGEGGPGGTGGGNPDDYTDNGLIRPRYTEITAQVRRMPLAMVLVIDQSYIQDALVAFTNSRLRMQNTQFHWNRFRGNLSYLSNSGTASMEGGPGMMLPGMDSGGGGRPGGRPPVGPGFPMGPMGGGRGVPSGSPAMGPGMPPGMGFPGMPSFGGPEAVTSFSEDQLAASLVELSLYGTASLFEKYDEKIKDLTVEELLNQPGMIGYKADPNATTTEAAPVIANPAPPVLPPMLDPEKGAKPPVTPATPPANGANPMAPMSPMPNAPNGANPPAASPTPMPMPGTPMPPMTPMVPPMPGTPGAAPAPMTNPTTPMAPMPMPPSGAPMTPMAPRPN